MTSRQDFREHDVSVVIPLYNHERYVEEALCSVLDQSHRPAEIIVVDDGSTDRSAEIVAKVARSEPRVTLWTQPNQDAPQTLNAGVHRATRDYVAILNSDDVYDPQRLAHGVAALRSDPSVTAFATAIRFIDGASAPVRFAWYEEARAFYDGCLDLPLALINGNFIMSTSNLILRRSVFHDIGYFSRLRYAHDLEFILRLLRSGHRIRLLDEPLLRYRVHAGNTIGEDHHKVRLEWAAVAATHLHYLSAATGSGTDWPGISKLVEILSRHDLLSLVLMFMSRFAKAYSAAPPADSYLRDPAFRDFLAGLR